jgi:regulation of enolase protein 1 (concanavalin A-like superfamily)
VKVTGKYRDLYDQTGRMIRWDESNWMKGFEVRFDDWTVQPEK